MLDTIELESELRRAQLQLLRAQMEPHFLFNVLANVRVLLHRDRSAALSMLTFLERYLAEALPTLRQSEVTLDTEIKLVEAYLALQQIRLGERLTYRLDIASELRAERIPSHVLLPLVENALKHGVGATIEGGSISVSARRYAGSLVLQVADTGKGLSATQGHGIGLANIRRRLTLAYGDEAVMALSRARPQGTIATVSFPAREPA